MKCEVCGIEVGQDAWCGCDDLTFLNRMTAEIEMKYDRETWAKLRKPEQPETSGIAIRQVHRLVWLDSARAFLWVRRHADRVGWPALGWAQDGCLAVYRSMLRQEVLDAFPYHDGITHGPDVAFPQRSSDGRLIDQEEVMKNARKGNEKCHGCGANTILRYRKKDGKPFLGCSTWPRCWKGRDAPEWVPWKDGLARREDEDRRAEARAQQNATRDDRHAAAKDVADAYHDKIEKVAHEEAMKCLRDEPTVTIKITPEDIRKNEEVIKRFDEQIESAKAENDRDLEEALITKAAEIRVASEEKERKQRAPEVPMGFRDVALISIAMFILCTVGYKIVMLAIGGE